MEMWKNKTLFKSNCSQAPVVHTCSPSHLGGRDWEDPFGRALVEQMPSSEYKPQYCKKNVIVLPL
jgi:hypothetical protein